MDRVNNRITLTALVGAMALLLCLLPGCQQAEDNRSAAAQPVAEAPSEPAESQTPPTNAQPTMAATDEPAPAPGDSEQAASDAPDEAETTTLVFTVTGMHCDGCANAVQDTLTRLPGVVSCRASFDESSATVVVDDPAVESKVTEAVAKMGYTIERAAETES